METHFGKFYVDEDRIFRKQMIGISIDFVIINASQVPDSKIKMY